jgi:hypothetical protein
MATSAGIMATQTTIRAPDARGNRNAARLPRLVAGHTEGITPKQEQELYSYYRELGGSPRSRADARAPRRAPNVAGRAATRR